MPDRDVNALRERVRQLEATIAALRSGELDAVLGSSESGSIYTLESDDRPYRLMVERMAEGAVTLDAEDRCVLYCNQAFAAMLRQPLASIMGRKFSDFLPEGEKDVAEQLAEPGGTRLSAKLRRADGVVPVSLASTAIESPDGNTLCVIVSDLSQRRIADRLRRKQAALESEAQRKDEFIAMLGHELRNPLAPIQHAAELLNAEDLDATQRAVVQATILRQTLHIRRLVDDLLDIARITRGSLKIERSEIDAREVVDAALETTRTLFVERQRGLRVQVPDRRVPIYADPVRLTQVVTNLLSNAAKFTRPGDTIVVRLSADHEFGTIEVSDTGRGIEPEMLATIFQAFVQEDVVFDSAVGGLGLGLALVKRIVELHDGVVRAASDGKGRGATFRVALPLSGAVDGAATRSPSATAEVAAKDQKILVCDDNTDAAEMMAMLLEAAGHVVTTVHTGEEAVRAAIADPPEVLFLDIGLPGLDGYEVARQLRSRVRTKDIVIVALTGYGQPEDRDAALSAGCDLHLVKPVDRAAIDGALGFRRVPEANR